MKTQLSYNIIRELLESTHEHTYLIGHPRNILQVKHEGKACNCRSIDRSGFSINIDLSLDIDKELFFCKLRS